MAELEKTLLSDSPQVISDMIDFGLLCGLVNTNSPDMDLTALKKLPKNRTLRWAGICALLEKSGAIERPEKLLRSLRLDTATIRSVSKGCASAFSGPPKYAVSWKMLIAAHGTETAKCAASAADMLYGAGHLKLLRSVLRSGDCFSLRSLAVSGNELIDLGFVGTEIGKTLSYLLDYVIEHPSENEKERLLLLARERRA